MRFHVAALLDGFSRKLLALKVYARPPMAVMMSALVRRTARTVGQMPRFIVTDHGSQFRKRFEKLVSGPKTSVVRCAVHCFKLTGKVERLFRTFKAWARMKLFAWFEDRKGIARWMKRKLDVFRDWYNTARPNQAVGGLTPEEAWSGVALPEAKPVRARDEQPVFAVRRRKYGGDPHLPVLDIAVEWPEAA
jgi:transposase InsO family protein